MLILLLSLLVAGLLLQGIRGPLAELTAATERFRDGDLGVRSRRLGACADLGYWMRSGIDPVKAVNLLKERLLTVQMHDINEVSGEGHDVPWGTGAGKTEAFIREVHRLGLQPTMWGLEYSHNWLESLPEIAQCAAFFDRISLQLAR